MSRRARLSGPSRGLLAAVALAMLLVAGCGMWNAQPWDLNRYRDERVVDIEHRLDREEPIVANPFTKAE